MPWDLSVVDCHSPSPPLSPFPPSHPSGQKLLAKLPTLFEGVEVRPCLLHGDLWSGNIAADAGGQPVILDPATYCEELEA